MKLSLRHFVLASFFTSIVGVGLFAYPSLAEDAGFDFWNVPEYQDRIRTAKQRHDDLDRKNQVVLQRTLLKTEAAEQLVAGIWTFEEAIGRFETINRTMPTGLATVNPAPGRTEREQASFQVVRYLRALRTPKSIALAEELYCLLLASQ